MAQRKTIRLPKGTLVFPCFVDEPDTSFADESNKNDKGDYKVRVAMPEAEAERIIAELQAEFDEFVEKKKIELGKKVLKIGDDALPWAAEADRDTGEPTGRIVFRTKMKARIVRKDGKVLDLSPVVFDAKGDPVIPIPPIGYGTIAKVNAAISCWHNGGKGCGMTLYLQALQVIDLVEKGFGKNAEDFGFEPEEGYVGAAAPATEQFAPDTEETDDNGGDY